MRLLTTCILTMTLLSCKNDISEDQKKLIREKTYGVDNFCEISSIEPVGQVQKGKTFAFQEFIMKLKIKRECISNAVGELCVSDLNFVEPNSGDEIQNRINLLFEHYKPNDTLTVQGILFDRIEKKNFTFLPTPALFYKTGNSGAMKDVTTKQICSEMNRYYSLGQRQFEIMGDDFPIRENWYKTLTK